MNSSEFEHRGEITTVSEHINTAIDKQNEIKGT